MDMGTVPEGNQIEIQLTITNSGTGPLHIDPPTSPPAPWSITNPEAVLNVGESSQFTVSFDATGQAPGQISNTFSIVSDDPGILHIFSIPPRSYLSLQMRVLSISQSQWLLLGPTIQKLVFTLPPETLSAVFLANLSILEQLRLAVSVLIAHLLSGNKEVEISSEMSRFRLTDGSSVQE